MAHEVGQHLQDDRDDRVEQLRTRELQPRVETRSALAVIEVDGGRLQIRGEGDGPGAHDSAWREDKIAVPATAAITVSESDPEPDLPAWYRDREYVEKLVGGISGSGPMSQADPQAQSLADSPAPASEPQNDSRKRPELLVRTDVASTCPSQDFGPMVAAEAQRRNFAHAAQRAFLGDGGAWIWKLKQEYFPTFQAIVDFLHVLTHLFTAAKATASAAEESGTLFQEWAEACWKGQVGQVIEQLHGLRNNLGPLPEGETKRRSDDDPRQILLQEIGSLEHNRERMDYPLYRRRGLPWTSSHGESTVKLFNRRGKGSEKFWGKTGAERILQLRAAYLSQDDRLERHLKTRPCGPFRTYKAREVRQAA